MNKGSKLIDNLINFNSKERFYLVRQILGNLKFVPDPAFMEELSQVLHLDVPKTIPFSAMDYHLDWLYASLVISEQNDINDKVFNRDNIIKAQQEDLDFILAYGCHIVLIEAKGVTGWTNKQMKSKADRLREIFGDDALLSKIILPT
jgi:hypothetical protein